MTISQETGWILDVEIGHLGTTLLEPAPVGALTLTVLDAVDFDTDGGVLDLNGAQLAYVAADPDVDTITLAEPLAVAAEEDDKVIVWDVDNNVAATDPTALVELVNGDSDDDPVRCTLPMSLVVTLPPGPRAGRGEVVLVENNDGQWRVLNVEAQQPTINGDAIDPETLPDTGGGGPTEPPTASPDLKVTGTAEGLLVEALQPLEAWTELTYHIVPASAVALDSGGVPIPFEPTAANQIGPATRGTMILVTALPDGTKLLTGTTYYVRAVAFNAIDDAPAGNMASGKLDPSVVHDLAVGGVKAGIAMVGALQVGPISMHPDSGVTIPGPLGDTRFKTDGTPHVFKGDVDTDKLTVRGGLTLNGETNAINGSLVLSNVVQPPSAAPGVDYTWEYHPAIGPNTWGIAEHSSTEWLTVHVGNRQIQKRSKATGAITATYGPYTGYNLFGVSRNAGGLIFAAAERNTEPDDFVVLKINASNGALISAHTIAADTEATAGYNAVGTDGTDLLVAWCRPNGTHIRVRRYNPADMSLLETSDYDFVTGTSFGTGVIQVSGVGRAPVGRGGATRTWMVVGTGLPIFDDVTKKVIDRAWVPEDNIKGAWWSPADNEMKAMGWDTYRVYRMPPTYWDADVAVGFTWFDSDAAAPGGQHETTLSPTVTFRPKTWSQLSVTTPPPADGGNPDDPDSVRIYLDGQRQPDLAPGQTTALFDGVTAGAAPPASNQFEGATAYPGELYSDRENISGIVGPLFIVKGDASGRWGRVKVEADGSVKLGESASISAAGVLDLGDHYHYSNGTGEGSGAGRPIPHGAWTKITNGWNPIDFRGIDFNGLGRWTATKPGRYSVIAFGQFAANANGARGTAVWKNGAEAAGLIVPPAATNSSGAVVVEELRLAAGDYVEVFIFHSVGAGSTLVNNGARMRMRWIGP